jgi:hypothetical protein
MTVNRSSANFNSLTVGSEGVTYTTAKDPGSTTPTESIVDGDYANWSTGLYPDGWGMWDAVNDTTPNPTGWSRSTDVQAGTYALELTANIDTGGGYASAALTGVYDTAVAEKTIQARFYAKYTTGTPVIGVIPYYWDGVNDYVWDITSGAWMISGTEDNGLEQVAITDSYTQVTSTQRTLPAGATEFWFDILVVGNQSDVALLDNVEWLLDGADVATNGTMEAWTEYANPISPLTSWTFAAGANNWGFDPLDVGDSSHITRGTDTQAGTYAVEFLVKGSGNGERGFIYQTITAAAGTSVDLSVYTKTSDAQTPYLICLDGVGGAMTQQYDFVGDVWDTQGTSPTDLPGTSNAKTLSGTTSYVENTHTVTVPASGTLVVVLMTDDGDGGAGYTYKFDTASGVADIVAGGVQIQQFPFKTDSNIADYQDNDRLVEFVASGNPADKILVLEVADNARPELDIEWLSDFPGVHNLENLDLYIATPTETYNPTTKAYVDALTFTDNVGVTATIDFTATGATTTGYTVPTGYKFVVSQISIETLSVDAPSGFTQLSVGTAGGYTNVASTMTAPSTTVGVVSTTFPSVTSFIAAGGEIFVNVSVGDGGTALTGKLYLFGTLIAV